MGGGHIFVAIFIILKFEKEEWKKSSFFNSYLPTESVLLLYSKYE
jgi:hypothetical protein